MQEIYNATNDIRSAIPHPRIMGVIKECGGKMWMGERMFIWLGFLSGIIQSYQVSGIELAKIFSSHSAIMMKRARPSEYKSSNTLFWLICSQAVRLTPSIVKRRNRRFSASGWVSWLSFMQIQERSSDQSNDRPCRRLSAARSSSCWKDLTRCVSLSETLSILTSSR